MSTTNRFTGILTRKSPKTGLQGREYWVIQLVKDGQPQNRFFLVHKILPNDPAYQEGATVTFTLKKRNNKLGHPQAYAHNVQPGIATLSPPPDDGMEFDLGEFHLTPIPT